MTNSAEHIRIPRELYGRIVKAKLYLDDNYTGPIRLDDAAAEASISPFHFLRLFKKAYRLTPHQHLTRLRLQHAKRLLAESELSLSEICTEVGFTSEGSFAGLFKRHTGHTPARYRIKMQERKQLAMQAPAHLTPSCFLMMNLVIRNS